MSFIDYLWFLQYFEGYISQTMKLGALGLPAYRAFSLEELEYATNNFESSAFMGEGSQGQVKVSSFLLFPSSESEISHLLLVLFRFIEGS